jgi:PIF1 helicase.
MVVFLSTNQGDWYFYNSVSSKDELIDKVFPNIFHNHKNHKWLNERAILAANNKDEIDLNFEIRNEIFGTLHSFKSIDRVTNEDEATIWIFKFLGYAWLYIKFIAESWLGGYDASKSKPTKAIQWNAFGDQCDSRCHFHS